MNPELAVNLRRDWVWTQCHETGNREDNLDSFTVMNYNILADCHVKEDWYPYCPRDCFKMADRHRQLMAEICHHKPDVICFQEVGTDYFVNQLNPAMLALGYLGSFFCKVKGVPEGEATFYQRERFHKVEEHGVTFHELIRQECHKANLSLVVQEKVLVYTKREEIVLLTKLCDVLTNRTVSIGNTHLLFDDYKNIDITSLQAGLAIKALIEFAGGIHQPHILCGDFNQEPNMTGYQLLHDGKLNAEGEAFIRQYPVEKDTLRQSLLDILPWCFQHPSTSLQSAYKAVLGHEIPFSNYDDYNGEEWPPRVPLMDLYCEVALDYQWFSSSSLQCLAVLEMISKELIKPLHACPNAAFPSDHLPVVARYRFRAESTAPS
ncbi:uncharacterized protein [Diadema antillarum]|uniref:uncharacterized protein n=1 Tax=Diadema antillarum TaxID=105358 RepID=UPI003A8BC288